jgi:hypothetical protein
MLREHLREGARWEVLNKDLGLRREVWVGVKNVWVIFILVVIEAVGMEDGVNWEEEEYLELGLEIQKMLDPENPREREKVNSVQSYSKVD